MFKIQDRVGNEFFVYLLYNRDVTGCILVYEGQNVVGLTLRSEKDIYNRSKGRKIAFTRAISIFPKDTREYFWRQYLTHYPLETEESKRNKSRKLVDSIRDQVIKDFGIKTVTKER